MKKIISYVVLSWLIPVVAAVQASSINYADGDLAPVGNPDGLLNIADYMVANRILSGNLNTDAQVLAHGDIYPLSAPDGVINLQDQLLLQQWILTGDRYYVENIALFADGPEMFSAEVGGNSSTTTLAVDGYTGPGATVINEPDFVDPENSNNIVWNVAVSGGIGNVFLTTSGLGSDPVLDSGFDFSGDGNGQLVFDIKVISLSAGALLTVKIDSGYPDLGQVTLQPSQYTVGSWRRVTIDFAELLANPGPGDGVDLANVSNAFVMEVTGGDAEFYLDNIFIKHSCPEVDGCQASVKTKPYVEYALIWSDEFEGTELNLDNWTYETGYGGWGWGNGEWQEYTTSTDNVSVSDGNLVISAQCETAPACGERDGSITSGRINTQGKFEFKYGKIQARIKPPVGQGSWPAFWMLGANFGPVPWPNTGEIDIMEMNQRYSNESTTTFTMHWCNEAWSNPCVYDPGWTYEYHTRSFAPISLGDDFHVFEAEWTSERVIGRIDGVEVGTIPIQPGTMDEFLEEFFTVLNVAIGGTLGGPPNATTTWPQTMLVDYVRVYQEVGGDGTYSISNFGNPEGPVAGIYSETNTSSVLSYSRIVNGADWGGNNTYAQVDSVAVTPYDGDEVLEVGFANTGKSYGGFIFDFNNGRDISAYQTLKFAMDTSAMPGFANLVVQIENPGGAQPAPKVQLSNYIPTIDNNWAVYEIPLSDFLGQAVSLSLNNVIYLGFWNAQQANGQLAFGTLYFDDIHLAGGE